MDGPQGDLGLNQLIKRLWEGEVPLGEAFWSYAVSYGLLLNVVTSFCFTLLLINGAPLIWLMVAFCIPLPYNLLAVVAVWRSADRYPGSRHRAELARVGTVFWMLFLTAA